MTNQLSGVLFPGPGNKPTVNTKQVPGDPPKGTKLEPGKAYMVDQHDSFSDHSVRIEDIKSISKHDQTTEGTTESEHNIIIMLDIQTSRSINWQYANKARRDKDFKRIREALESYVKYL